MGTIVCQTCDATIAYFEDEKVTRFMGNVIAASMTMRAEKKNKTVKPMGERNG